MSSISRLWLGVTERRPGTPLLGHGVIHVKKSPKGSSCEHFETKIFFCLRLGFSNVRWLRMLIRGEHPRVNNFMHQLVSVSKPVCIMSTNLACLVSKHPRTKACSRSGPDSSGVPISPRVRTLQYLLRQSKDNISRGSKSSPSGQHAVPGNLRLRMYAAVQFLRAFRLCGLPVVRLGGEWPCIEDGPWWGFSNYSGFSFTLTNESTRAWAGAINFLRLLITRSRSTRHIFRQFQLICSEAIRLEGLIVRATVSQIAPSNSPYDVTRLVSSS